MVEIGRLKHPGLRAAAIRYERETGRRLADELGVEQDEGIIGVFLIVNGYPPDRPDAGEHVGNPDPGPKAA
jgi:hypothetical protein